MKNAFIKFAESRKKVKEAKEIFEQAKEELAKIDLENIPEDDLVNIVRKALSDHANKSKNNS